MLWRAMISYVLKHIKEQEEFGFSLSVGERQNKTFIKISYPQHCEGK